MRFLNGFVLIGIILLFISVAGLVKGNTILTEPGQPVNQFAWLEYLGAALLMLLNGAVSIYTMRKNEPPKPPENKPETAETASVEATPAEPAAGPVTEP